MAIEIHIDKEEVLRYLGMKKAMAEDNGEAVREVEPLIDEAIGAILRTAQPRIVARRFPLTHEENGSLTFAGISTDSASLSRNLTGCTEVLILGATLGTGVDRLIERNSRTRISLAVVLQAAAAAAIEDYLDSWQKLTAEELQKEGLFLRPRFSPGYGDFPLENQPRFIAVLEAPKKIGLTCTDSLMLAPVKSVTALIGLSKEDSHCIRSGCESCRNTGCEFRRS